MSVRNAANKIAELDSRSFSYINNIESIIMDMLKKLSKSGHLVHPQTCSTWANCYERGRECNCGYPLKEAEAHRAT